MLFSQNLSSQIHSVVGGNCRVFFYASFSVMFLVNVIFVSVLQTLMLSLSCLHGNLSTEYFFFCIRVTISGSWNISFFLLFPI